MSPQAHTTPLRAILIDYAARNCLAALLQGDPRPPLIEPAVWDALLLADLPAIDEATFAILCDMHDGLCRDLMLASRREAQRLLGVVKVTDAERAEWDRVAR